jgi:hypothetical protein
MTTVTQPTKQPRKPYVRPTISTVKVVVDQKTNVGTGAFGCQSC